ncbi:MAG: hypothetical protein ACRDGK_04780, partial [Actinomycetota bacterium]
PSVRGTVGLVVVLLAAAACAPPRYEYVRNTEARTAFRIPTEWTVFEESTVSGVDSTADTPDTIDWLVGIDANPQPNVANVYPSDFATDYPQGFAAVLTLTGESRDVASLQVLRNLLIPIDQIRDEVGSDAVRVLEYDDALVRDGYRGLQMVVQVQEAALLGAALPSGSGGAGFLSDTYVQMNQVMLVDDVTQHAYILFLLCSADCYARNRGDIHSAIDSWTVLP